MGNPKEPLLPTIFLTSPESDMDLFNLYLVDNAGVRLATGATAAFGANWRSISVRHRFQMKQGSGGLSCLPEVNMVEYIVRYLI